jgi:hypothetical protein
MRTKLFLLLVSLLGIGFAVQTSLSSEKDNQVESVKPYTPSRIEWAVVWLNSYLPVANSDFIGIRWIIKDENTISLLHSPKGNANYLNYTKKVDEVIDQGNEFLKTKGWDKFIKIEKSEAKRK